MPPRAKDKSKAAKYAPLPRSGSAQAAALKQKGSNAYSSGDFDLALNLFLEAHALDPQPLFLSNAATTLCEVGEYSECLSLCELALMSSAIDDPENAAIRAKLMIREFRALGMLRKWYRAEMSCDRMLAAHADGSIQDSSSEAKNRKEVFRKMATTLDISPEFALPRLMAQPVHRPAHKRLLPYLCVRQNDLPSLTMPRLEGADANIRPLMGEDEERTYRVLFAPRGDPRPLLRLWAELERAVEMDRRRLLGSSIDDFATELIEVDIIDNNVVSVARALVMVHLLLKLKAVPANDRVTATLPTQPTDTANTKLARQIMAQLFYLSFSPVMPSSVHIALSATLSELLLLLDSDTGLNKPGTRVMCTLDPAHASEIRYVISKWIDGAKIKMSRVLRATKAAAKAQAEQAAAAKKGRKEDEDKDGPVPGVASGCLAEHRAYPTLAVLRPPDFVLETEPADVRLAFDRLTTVGNAEVRTEGERQRLEDCIHDRVEAAWTFNPTFWDPSRAPEDLLLRFGDPTRAIHAQELDLGSFGANGPAYVRHALFLLAAANAMASASVPPTHVTFGGKILSDRFFDHGIGHQPLISDRPYHRVVLADTLDYSDGHLGALIAFQQIPLAVNAVISLEERVFRAPVDTTGRALAPPVFRHWASTCVTEAQLAAVHGVKRAHVKGERSTQWHLVSQGELPVVERIRSAELQHILLTVFLRVACGAQFANHAPPTEAAQENLNMHAFFRFVYGLARRGYPGHWLSRAIEAMLENRVESSVMPAPKRPFEPVRRLEADEPLCLAPFSVELEVLSSLWAPVLPFPIASLKLHEPSEIGRYRVTFDPVPGQDKASKKDSSRLDYPNVCLGFFAPYESHLEFIDILTSLNGRRSTTTSLIVLTVFEYDAKANTVHFLMPIRKMLEIKDARWLVALGPDFKRRVHVRSAVIAGDVDGPRAGDPPMPEPVAPPPPSGPAAKAKTGGKKKKGADADDSDSSAASVAPRKKTKAAPSSDGGESDDSENMPGLVPIEEIGKAKAVKTPASSKPAPPTQAKAKSKAKSKKDDVDDVPDDMPGLIPVDDDEEDDFDEDDEDDEEDDEDDEEDDASDASDGTGSESMPGLIEV